MPKLRAEPAKYNAGGEGQAAMDALARHSGHDGNGIVRRGYSTATSAPDAVAEIGQNIGTGDLAFVMAFISPAHDRAGIAHAFAVAYPETPVIGCTTAGEIGPAGYTDGALVVLGFPDAHFAVTTRLIPDLAGFSVDDGAGIAGELLSPSGKGEAALWPHSFALLLADGLSRQEDALVASLAPSLGAIPLIGGSAGDGLDFGETFVLHGGTFHQGAAVVALVRTTCPVRAFHMDNFVPTDRRMVVTGADPAERLVTEINAEPAAREYARVVGKDPNQLSPFIFAENPVVVRIGGDHFCRSIQKVEPNGDLRFYCAIDEGLVLTVASSADLVEHLDRELTGLREQAEPAAILAFDCILRRLDAERSQRTLEVSEVLARHEVTGFSTYGEQFGGMHLNQTFSGAAIYPPDTPDV